MPETGIEQQAAASAPTRDLESPDARVAMPESQPADTQKRKSPEVITLELVSGEIRDGRVELFCDHTDLPSIRIHDDEMRDSWPLRHGRVRGWIAWLYRHNIHDVLANRQIDSVLNVLEGEAWKGGRRDADDRRLVKVFEEEPVIGAVVEFVRTKGVYEATASELLKELTSFAERRGIIRRRHRKWPEASWVLSKKLRLHTRTLKQAGVQVQFNRTNTKRSVQLVQISPADGDALTVMPSPVSSQHKSGQCNNLDESDACDETVLNSALLARLDEMKRNQEL